MSPDTPNVIQTMTQLDQSKPRAKTTNKIPLQTDKEKDAAEKAVEELKRQLQPKRAHTVDDAGDVHDLFADVNLVQARIVSCITRVLVWLGGFHIGDEGTLL